MPESRRQTKDQEALDWQEWEDVWSEKEKQLQPEGAGHDRIRDTIITGLGPLAPRK